MKATALLRASDKGNTELVRKLLQEQPDIEMRARGTGRTPLIEAVIGGHLETTAVLLAARANVEARDEVMRFTPLAWAVINKHALLVRMLLEHGAHVDSRNGAHDDTPLMLAASGGQAEIIRTLLEHAARVDVVNSTGQNALSTCDPGESDGPAQVRRILVEAGATAASPVPEPPALPWPSVTLGNTAYEDPVAVVRGYIIQLAKWEREVVTKDAQGLIAPLDLVALFQQRDELAAIFLSDRVRTYRPHSFGTPPEVDERETLHAIDYPKPTRCELLVRDSVDHPFRSERLYTVVKKRGEWRLDTLKARPLGTTAWRQRLL